MKKTTIIFGVLGIFIIVTIAMLLSSQNENQEKQNFGQSSSQINLSASQEIKNDQYQHQADNQGNITIEVTPKQIGVNEEKNMFAVSFNTHSVELDFDFTKIISLKDDLGNVYSVLEWTGNRGGHHVNGNVIFPKINQQASAVELQINGINGVNRIFKWTLNQNNK